MQCKGCATLARFSTPITKSAHLALWVPGRLLEQDSPVPQQAVRVQAGKKLPRQLADAAQGLDVRLAGEHQSVVKVEEDRLDPAWSRHPALVCTWKRKKG